MPLAIVSFALEMIFIFVAAGLGENMTQGFAIFTIVLFVICTIISIGCIIYNSAHIKEGIVSKGVCVTGLVFSIVGAVIGLIFCITCFATMAALL